MCINGFIPFVDPENIGLDTTIVILCKLELEILARYISNLVY